MRTRAKLVLAGAGGHGRVVYDTLQKGTRLAIEVRDDDQRLANNPFLDTTVKVPIVLGTEHGMQLHVAIGANDVREKVWRKGQAVGMDLVTIVDPNATVSRFAKLGRGCFVAAGAIVSARASIGEGAIVNHNAVVDHDCQVGAWSHIGPGAVLGGGAVVGDLALVGSLAVVLAGCFVGEKAVVGAGAVVRHDVPPGCIVVGVPAQRIDRN